MREPITIALIEHGRAEICRSVLTGLPEWFGVKAARERYIRFAAEAPMIAASYKGEVIGFVSLAEHFERNCELHSMGVRRDWHRRGVGRELVEAASFWASERGHAFLSVKTLSDQRPDRGYEATRRFYRAIGFEPFEVLTELWGPDLPCLVMLKTLPESPVSRFS